MPWRQTPHEHQINKQIEITGHALPRYPQARRYFHGIEQTTLLMGQHGPEAFQSLHSSVVG
jgi:hypothetical protein